MIDFIKQNISWIKDIFSVIFTGVATILAVLTYIRAKDTILQPIRSEVIKRQSEILSELLELISKKDFSLDLKLDYIKLAQINALKTLEDYGFVLKNHKVNISMRQSRCVNLLEPRC